MTVTARTNLAVTLFGLLRAKFAGDKEFHDKIQELQADLQKLREEYEPVMDAETWAADEKNRFELFLDHIEYRLYEIVVNTKIIDSAGLREMAVPE